MPIEHGKIIIEISGELLDKIDVHISAGSKNQACVTPIELFTVLLRVLSTCVILSNNNMRDVMFSVCKLSGLIADEIQEFAKGNYSVKIHLPETSESNKYEA